MLNNFFLSKTVYEIMWKNVLETDGLQMVIRRMRVACWISNAADTRSEYEILTAFLQQQWQHECSQCYICAYISSLVLYTFNLLSSK